MKLFSKIRIYKLFLQMFKYFWVAVVATIVDYSSFLVAHKAFGISIYLANTLAFVLGLITNYGIATKYVFNAQSNKSFKEFFAFSLIGVFGLFISNITLFITIDLLLIGVAVAKVIAIATTFFWNFGARKVLLFNKNLRNEH